MASSKYYASGLIVLGVFCTILKTIFILWSINTSTASTKWSTSETKTKKLLTIFTTFRESPGRNLIQKNVILNWVSLGDNIQPILFTNLSAKSELTSLALEKGWIVLETENTSSIGIPFLKGMYQKAMATSDSHFYGFCNGDILFNSGLFYTLSAILDVLRYLQPSTMVIGRRTNLNFKQCPNKTTLYLPDNLSANAIAWGKLFGVSAVDYFIIGHSENFPWHTIKDVVIGKMGYDNYFVAQARRGNVSVIDASETVLALHQTGSDGNFAGLRSKNRYYNYGVIGKYNYRSGFIHTSAYYTKMDIIGRVFLKLKNPPRKPKPKKKGEPKESAKRSNPKSKGNKKPTKSALKKVLKGRLKDPKNSKKNSAAKATKNVVKIPTKETV